MGDLRGDTRKDLEYDSLGYEVARQQAATQDDMVRGAFPQAGRTWDAEPMPAEDLIPDPELSSRPDHVLFSTTPYDRYNPESWRIGEITKRQTFGGEQPVEITYDGGSKRVIDTEEEVATTAILAAVHSPAALTKVIEDAKATWDSNDVEIDLCEDAAKRLQEQVNESWSRVRSLKACRNENVQALLRKAK